MNETQHEQLKIAIEALERIVDGNFVSRPGQGYRDIAYRALRCIENARSAIGATELPSEGVSEFEK